MINTRFVKKKYQKQNKQKTSQGESEGDMDRKCFFFKVEIKRKQRNKQGNFLFFEEDICIFTYSLSFTINEDNLNFYLIVSLYENFKNLFCFTQHFIDYLKISHHEP